MSLASVAQTVDILTKVKYGVILFGLVGNTITLVVFFRKAFRNSSIGIYSRALAISELTLLVFQFVNQTFVIFVKSDVFSGIDILCKISLYVNFVFPAISAWILVAFSVDKVLCIVFPNKFEIVKKTSFQITLILAIVIIHFLAFVEVPIFTEPRRTNNQAVVTDCNTRYLSFYFAISIVYLLETLIVPFLIMFASSVLIIRALYQSRTRIVAHQSRDAAAARKAKDFKFAVNSIVLNILFIALQIPVVLFSLLNITDRPTLIVFGFAAALCFTMNFAKLFIGYFISNSIFRQELFNMVRFKASSSDSFTARTRTQSKSRK